MTIVYSAYTMYVAANILSEIYDYIRTEPTFNEHDAYINARNLKNATSEKMRASINFTKEERIEAYKAATECCMDLYCRWLREYKSLLNEEDVKDLWRRHDKLLTHIYVDDVIEVNFAF